mgnify:CR=1 FL=1
MHSFTPNTVTESAKVNANFTGLADGSEIIDKAILPRHISDSLGTAWLPLGEAPDTFTYNGNRSYTLVFNSTDLTDTLSEGMRLRTTRTVSAPTQCADLESGSSQYFSKTTPTGVSQTDDITVMAWIKLESYTGANQTIMSRFSSTGWGFRINTAGQVSIFGKDAGVADSLESYQSVPLNKWVHVAATLDISASANSKVYIDGVEVPALYTNGATTVITPSGNLQIGALNGAEFFDGKIGQVALFSSVLSASTIRSYMSQTLSGAESTCVGFFSLNNTLVDTSSNANTVTAQGSALATNVDSPFGNYLGGTLEYGIISAKPTFSTNTTVTVQVPEGCAIPTSGGISSVSYSTNDVPYGFPRDEGQWKITTIGKSGFTTGTLSVGVGATLNRRITIPIGSWKVGYESIVQLNGSSGTQEYETFLNTSTTAIFDELSCMGYTSSNAGYTSALMARNSFMKLSAQTDYLLGVIYNQGTGTITAQMNEYRGITIIYATPAFL